MKRRSLIIFFAACFLFSAFSTIIGSIGVNAATAVSGGSGGNNASSAFDGAVMNASYTFQDRAVIVANIQGVGNVNFTDSDISDGTNAYMPPVTNTSTNNSFCNQGLSGTTGIVLPKNASWGANTVSGTLNIGIWEGAKCIKATATSVSVSNPNQVANAKFEWAGTSIKYLGASGTQFDLGANEPAGSQAYYTSAKNGDCPQQAIGLGGSNNSGTLYSLTNQGYSGGARGGGTVYPAAPSSLNVPSDCHVTFQRSINIAGTQGGSPVGGGGGGGGGSGPQQVTCDTSGFNLSWAICPVIYGAISAIQGIYSDLIQPLLRMDSQQLLDPAKGYYKAWSAFRDYANVLLIIILLVIVFGEAIGGGG